jgi:hypothetical protein
MLKRKIKELKTLKGKTLDLTKGLINATSIKEVGHDLGVE